MYRQDPIDSRIPVSQGDFINRLPSDVHLKPTGLLVAHRYVVTISEWTVFYGMPTKQYQIEPKLSPVVFTLERLVRMFVLHFLLDSFPSDV
jgi:hypothetical protein